METEKRKAGCWGRGGRERRREFGASVLRDEQVLQIRDPRCAYTPHSWTSCTLKSGHDFFKWSVSWFVLLTLHARARTHTHPHTPTWCVVLFPWNAWNREIYKDRHQVNSCLGPGGPEVSEESWGMGIDGVSLRGDGTVLVQYVVDGWTTLRLCSELLTCPVC